MDDDTPTSDARVQALIDAANTRHAALADEVIASRKQMEAALQAAIDAGWTRTRIAERVALTREGTRKALRRIGVGPAPQGRQPASASKASDSST